MWVLDLTNNIIRNVISSVFRHISQEGERNKSRVKVIESIQSDKIKSNNKTWLSQINNGTN